MRVYLLRKYDRDINISYDKWSLDYNNCEGFKTFELNESSNILYQISPIYLNDIYTFKNRILLDHFDNDNLHNLRVLIIKNNSFIQTNRHDLIEHYKRL